MKIYLTHSTTKIYLTLFYYKDLFNPLYYKDLFIKYDSALECTCKQRTCITESSVAEPRFFFFWVGGGSAPRFSKPEQALTPRIQVAIEKNIQCVISLKTIQFLQFFKSFLP